MEEQSLEPEVQAEVPRPKTAGQADSQPKLEKSEDLKAAVARKFRKTGGKKMGEEARKQALSDLRNQF